ncbi:MAG TPA: hypothetical protein VJ396_01125 [Acidiferrobacterales bacterium]|nr:hypothetical protein [Acidiferrobacterales bacterium]
MMGVKELGRLSGYGRVAITGMIGDGLIVAIQIGRGLYVDRLYAARIIPLLRVRRTLQYSLGTKGRNGGARAKKQVEAT